MLGGVVKLQFPRDPAGFGRREASLVQRGGGMGIEIIHHQPDPIRCGEVAIDQQVTCRAKSCLVCCS